MLVLLKCVWLGVTLAVAGGYFPPVNVLEKQLNARPGAQIPKDIAYNGKIFHAYYVHSVAKGNGEYNITVKLTDY